MDKRPSDQQLDLIPGLADASRQIAAEAPTAGEPASPSALDEWCARVSPATKSKLMRMVRSSGMGDNDPLIVGLACLQLEHDEHRAELEALVVSAVRATDGLVSAETGATKYAARLHEIMEETRIAVEEAETYRAVLVKSKETGSEVLRETLRPLLTGLLWKTAAVVIAADFALRLLLTFFR